MIRLDQPLPDRRERPVAGDYKMQRPPRGGAYVPREVPTIDSREVATLPAITAALESAGFTCTTRGDRAYVAKGGDKYGYVVAGDDGSTDTCSGITRRAGTIAEILRNA